MTNSAGNRVSLTPGDWLKVVMFLVVQSAALIGVGVDMRERLVIVETRLQAHDDSFADLRGDVAEMRKEIAELRTK